MTFRGDFSPDTHYPAIRVDKECIPLGSEDLLAVHRFFFPGLVRLNDLVSGIRKKQDRKVMAIGKLSVALRRILAHPDDLCSQFCE